MDTHTASPSEAFRHEVAAFIERSGMSRTTFGTQFAGDPNFLQNLSREYRWDTIQRIRTKMAEHGDAA